MGHLEGLFVLIKQNHCVFGIFHKLAYEVYGNGLHRICVK